MTVCCHHLAIVTASDSALGTSHRTWTPSYFASQDGGENKHTCLDQYLRSIVLKGMVVLVVCWFASLFFRFANGKVSIFFKGGGCWFLWAMGHVLEKHPSQNSITGLWTKGGLDPSPPGMFEYIFEDTLQLQIDMGHLLFLLVLALTILLDSFFSLCFFWSSENSATIHTPRISGFLVFTAPSRGKWTRISKILGPCFLATFNWGNTFYIGDSRHACTIGKHQFASTVL